MSCQHTIQIQTEDFCLADQYCRLRTSTHTGAIVTFVGLVRDFQTSPNTETVTETDDCIYALALDHYPTLANQQLTALARQASERWSLQHVEIIHRVGKLQTGDQIVYVGVAASHRQAAYEANQFIMDRLKSEVAFWKRIYRQGGSDWVDANPNDAQLADRWIQSTDTQ